MPVAVRCSLPEIHLCDIKRARRAPGAVHVSTTEKTAACGSIRPSAVLGPPVHGRTGRRCRGVFVTGQLATRGAHGGVVGRICHHFAVVHLVHHFVAASGHIRRVARMEDPSRVLSLVLVVLGAAAALLAVLVLLQSSMEMESQLKKGAIVLAVSAVVLAWGLIHTVFTLRYAHLYHGAEDGKGGLQFPGDESCPEYLDFAYFAFVIGMTAQTSDIGITSRRMRMNALIHGLISFAFNTAVVALSIGVLTTLI